jgi:hypothetical protein
VIRLQLPGCVNGEGEQSVLVKVFLSREIGDRSPGYATP